MLVRYGGGITDASGSIGGTTASRNRFGKYFRARVTPVNPNSSRQQFIRSIMSDVASQWLNTLTALQRAAWEVYAAAIPQVNKLGETILLTGFNMFVRSNAVILDGGLTLIEDGPTTLSLPIPDSTFAIAASEATQLITVTFDDTATWAITDDGAMTVQMGIPQPETREFFGGPFRKAGTLLGNTAVPLTSPQTIAAPFPIAEGQKIWARARIIEPDGRVSTPFRDDDIVAV